MSSSPPLSSYTLFLDRNFGKYSVARELRAYGYHIEVHVDHFQATENTREVSDADWIREVASRGWVIFTRNGRIRYNPLEKTAFMKAGARVFNIRDGSAPAQEVAEAVRLAQNRIERILATEPGPFIAGISKRGEVTFINR